MSEIYFGKSFPQIIVYRNLNIGPSLVKNFRNRKKNYQQFVFNFIRDNFALLAFLLNNNKKNLI